VKTPLQDPTFQAGCYVFGYTLPGTGYFGNARTYHQQSIFGLRAFGTEIPGKNTENDVFQLHCGSPTPKTLYYKKGEWRLSPSPWPVTPNMSVQLHGPWAKRIIHCVKYGKPHRRRYTPYDSSAKETIVPWQLKLMESSFLWSCLTDENKARLNADAKRTQQATQGHNYFVKLYIKDDPRWLDYV